MIVDHSLLEMRNTASQNFSQNWKFGKDLQIVVHCKEDMKTEKSFEAPHYQCPVTIPANGGTTEIVERYCPLEVLVLLFIHQNSLCHSTVISKAVLAHTKP